VNSPEEAFFKLVGQQPTDEARQRLYRIQNALGIKNTDSLWVLMIALQYYQALYERIPQKIAAAAAEAVAAAKMTAGAQAKAAAEETKKALTEGVRRTLDETTKRAALHQIVKWVGVTASVLSVFLLAVGRWEFHSGEVQGQWRAEKAAQEDRNRRAAESLWANTPDGRQAYDLAKSGILHNILNCSGRGLVARDGWCIALGDRGGALRWRLSEGSRSP
jgi:hypothetical protein